ncbi:MAG: hypothetical protein CME69_03260 [Halobacteriovorax sp.]|nr:hypothetical protein [Halobacteriovorax sp.]
MIDKLIESLKEQLAQVRSKLPGGGDDDYEDETDVDITTSGLDVTKATGRKSRKSFDEDDEDDEYEDDEDVDDASAKKSKYIRIFVIVGLTYYGITEFVVKEEPQAPAKVVKKKAVQDKTTRKKVKEKPRTVKKASAVADKNNKVEPDKYPRIEKEKNEIDVKEPSKNNQLSNDNNQDTDKFDEVDKSSEAAVSDPMVTDISENENQNTEMNTTSDNTGIDSDFTDMMNQIESEVEDKDATESMQDQLNKIVEKVSEKKENPVQEVDYVEAPDYEKFGRGLVYNCKEGHWACVDKESWFQCRQNDYWTKQNNKPKECVISDVYSSISDCRVMQLENINKVLKPECN